MILRHADAITIRYVGSGFLFFVASEAMENRQGYLVRRPPSRGERSNIAYAFLQCGGATRRRGFVVSHYRHPGAFFF